MKKRVISAIIALSIFIPLVIEGNILFRIGILILGILGLREIINIKNKKYPFLFKFCSYFLLSLFILNNSIFFNFNFIVDYKILSSLFLVFGVLFLFYKDIKLSDITFIIFFVLLIGISFNLIILFRMFNLNYFIYLFLITMATDSYAYIAGNLIGKHKLLESVSPKKTIEGLVIGSIFGTLISSTYYYIYINDSVNIVTLLLLTLLLTLLGQYGDLFFSKIKREFNIKDFSNIMPGHGGILDRLDSIIFVVLGFCLFLSYL